MRARLMVGVSKPPGEEDSETDRDRERACAVWGDMPSLSMSRHCFFGLTAWDNQVTNATKAAKASVGVVSSVKPNSPDSDSFRARQSRTTSTEVSVPFV